SDVVTRALWIRSTILLVSSLACACGSTGQELTSFPIHGAASGERSFTKDGWTVTLERADVAFGPVYFCATSFADMDVCPSAQAEWLETQTIDALDPTPQMLGEAEAVTGTVRSAMFDYGRSWLLTEPRVRANEGAPEGHSAVFVVHLDDGDAVVEIRAAIDIDPAAAGQSAVIGAPTGVRTI